MRERKISLTLFLASFLLIVQFYVTEVNAYTPFQDIILYDFETSYQPSPILGNLAVLVVPIQFLDVKASYSVSSILSKVSSMSSYWNEVSYGKVSVGYSAPFSSWLTLNNNMAYYGADSGETIDVNWRQLIYDSLNAADPYVDFRKFQYVIIIHAGRDQASSHISTDIWSKATLGKWFFNIEGGVYLGISIISESDPYGVFCHEFGHNINLPDLYNPSNTPEYAGKWSLMDHGSWLNPPSSVMAVEKSWLGWISSNIYTISDKAIVNITLSRLGILNGTVMAKVQAGSTYYTIEYRKKVGTDSALPREGIIIAYVNEDLGSGKVKVQDANPITSSLDDAAYPSGGRFVDRSNAVAVRVLETGLNTAKVMVQKGFANLKISSFQTHGVFVEGERVSFDTIVSNNGDVSSNYCIISLYVDGVKVNSTGVSTIPAGESRSFSLGWNAVKGTHTISIKIDDADDVVEYDENDNIFSTTVYVGAHVVVDKSWVSRPRTDVGLVEKVGFHVIWSNGSQINGGILYVNGTAYSINASGWVCFEAQSQLVSKLSWRVTGVNVNGITVYRQTVSNPSIVWDMVEIILSPIGRSSVGSEAKIKVDGTYSYDKSPFKGQVSFNDTLVKNSVGAYGYRVSAIIDKTYGLKCFISNTITVVFDKIQITLEALDSRTDVGSNASISFSGKHLYDGVPFNGRVEYNLNLTQKNVGNYSYTVSKIVDYDYGVTAFESNTVHIVFDRIVILENGASAKRCGVNTIQEVWVKLCYEYDGVVLGEGKGIVYVNGTLARWDPVGKRWAVYVKESSVGKKVYFAPSEVKETFYGIKTLKANVSSTVEIVWDKIVFTLFPKKSRFSVGGTAEIEAVGYYLYDGRKFEGTIEYNDTLSKSTVGKYYYTISNVHDRIFNIKEFESNSVEIVFDKIVFQIENVKQRVPIGAKANLTIKAYYAYDGKEFRGHYALNNDLTKITVGKYNYTIVHMEDPLYELTAFESNTVTVTFDRINYNVEANTIIPGTIEYAITLKYESDGAPVEDAKVYVNNILTQKIGNGKYVLRTQCLSLKHSYDVSIITELGKINTKEQTLVIGNFIIILIASVVGAIGLAFLLVKIKYILHKKFS
ncbi:MAG: M6 family metalloprotease domain-containing protein [Nitrososphaeria archaeon]